MVQRQHKMVSLKYRFITLALILGCILIAGTIISHYHSQKAPSEAFSRLEIVSEHSTLVSNIQTNIADAYRFLNLFLLSADQSSYKESYHKKIQDAQNNLSELKKLLDAQNTHFEKDTSDEIKKLIQTLNNEALHLFEIRVTPTLQYPAMNIAFNQMQPNRNTVTGSLSLAIRELEQDDLDFQDAKVYQAFFKTQQLWTTMISEFRIYLANRMGSFYEQGLSQHEININDYYVKLMQQMALLQVLKRKGKLGFEASASVDDIERAIQAWKQGFDKVSEVHNSPHWRNDTMIIHGKIIPLMDKISLHLDALNKEIKSQDEDVFTRLATVSNNQSLILTSVILFFVFYILSTLISIERMVFKPIATIANALKSAAFGHHGELQEHAKILETQVLVDAFEEMHLQVKNRQKELEHQTLHDDLTKLPNRVMLKDRLDYHLTLNERNKQKLALFILDLNQFKEVNDTLGHHVGDQLLIQVGERFTKLLRDRDTIARLGGDEFAILLPNTNAIQAINVAEKINEAIETTFIIDDYKLHIGVSIGIAIYPQDGEDLHTLMQHADVAMYVAKRNKRNYSHYDPKEDENSITRLSLVNDLRKALANDELNLYFQPKISLEKNQVSGAEALLRWNHPEFGFVNPEQIVLLAEQVGLINELTEWIVDKAIMQCSSCHQAGYPISMAINLSVQNLRNHKICAKVKECLQKYQINSEHIILEITESAMMHNPERSLGVLNAFSDMGVHLSIDDFGTGFSSLAYIKKFPVDELKIDKSFIMELDKNKSDDVIVRSTIELGHNLGLRIVAEGVEHLSIYESLQALGCDTAQGYYMSKPLEEKAFLQWLDDNSNTSIIDSEQVAHEMN